MNHPDVLALLIIVAIECIYFAATSGPKRRK